MLYLKSVYLDRGNCRLYCRDNKSNDWAIINDGSSRTPNFVAYSVTNEGEPLDPILSSINWILVDGEEGTPFVTGLSNNINNKAFKSDDGYFLYYVKEDNTFSDGDLIFDVSNDGFPVDYRGHDLSGEMLGMFNHIETTSITDEHSLRVLKKIFNRECVIEELSLHALVDPVLDGNGFLTSVIRDTTEYKQVKINYDRAFLKLQNFNKILSNDFKRNISVERRQLMSKFDLNRKKLEFDLKNANSLDSYVVFFSNGQKRTLTRDSLYHCYLMHDATCSSVIKFIKK